MTSAIVDQIRREISQADDLPAPTASIAPVSIALRLRQARLDRGLTCNQARNAIGYTFDTYALTEMGGRLPRPNELPALALWLCNGEGGIERFLDTLRTLRNQLAVERGHGAQPIAPVAP